MEAPPDDSLLPGPSAVSTATAESQQPLYYSTDRLFERRDIPVCWRTAGDPTRKAWVMEAVKGQRSWAQQANLSFTGWGDCPADFSRGIRLSVGSSMVTRYPADQLADIELDFESTSYTRCSGLSERECLSTVTLHEFGHAIGFKHEHNRDDTSASCTSATQGTQGNRTYGPWDGRSIMAYCDYTTELSPMDRLGTRRLYGQPYADPPRLGDFNGDGRDDLLCHHVRTGAKWVDLASATGTFMGTDWQRDAGWCQRDTSRIFKGDFNGDGRSDLLCHDMISGSKWIDYAGASGEFTQTDWSRAAAWCKDENSRLLVGDFDGDGRDDLLCHDAANGNKWIDYASTSGQFTGTDWSRPAAWCMGNSSRIYVGDFNGDRRDDLLCHDVAAMHMWLDYADSNGRFEGTDANRGSNWCTGLSAELFIGDFNGDRRDDLLCHEAATGHKWIDYADPSGRFAGTDWNRAASWCKHNAGRLHLGDVNGDGRSDMLCHDVANGTKWVDLADGEGRFMGNNWEHRGGWCDGSAGEIH